MLEKWIELQRELPPGIRIIKEQHRLIVDRIQNLCDEDLMELDAFLNFLADGSDSLVESNTKKTPKIFDFMAGGVQRAG